MPYARKPAQQRDEIFYFWYSKLKWSCCDLISAAEGKGGTGEGEGGVAVREGSDEPTLGLGRHGDCVSDKVRGMDLIVGFCKGMAYSRIVYWLQETNIAPLQALFFQFITEALLEKTDTQVHLGHKEEILE